MPKTNDAALDAFIGAKNEIDAILARLSAHSADHFGYSPEEVNWAMSARWTIIAPAFVRSPTSHSRRAGQSTSPWPAC